MAVFGTDLANHQSDLEEALKGMVPTSDFEYKFQNIYAPLFYVVPVKYIGESVYGFFQLEDKIHQARLGLEQFSESGASTFFHYKNEGFVQGGFVGKTLFLPLQESPFLISDSEGEGTYPSYGIRGVDQNAPVMFLYEVEQGMCLVGFRKDAAGGISPYQKLFEGDEQEPYREYWQDFFLGNLNDPAALEEVVNEQELDDEVDELVSERETDPGGITAPEPEYFIDWEWWAEPKNIVQYLDDEGVIGQYRTKKALAVVFSDLMAQIRAGVDPIKKKNMLLIGNSGTGKTMMLYLLAEKAQIPIVRCTMTNKSPDGYIGSNPKDVLDDLRDMTMGIAPYAIYFVHEIDKTVRDHGLSSGGWGPNHQDTFIGWGEEEEVTLDTKENGRPRKINTRNILFVYDGAFVSGINGSLQELAGERGDEKVVGFKTDDERKKQKKKSRITIDDVIEYGMKEEWAGRIRVIATLHPLSLSQRVEILRNPKSSPLQGYEETFDRKGYTLHIKAAALDIIAAECSEKTGARALGQICEHLFFEIEYDPALFATDDKTITITKELAEKLLVDYEEE